MPLTKKAERTKAKLTASARKLISERGFDNVSVEEITKDAGVAKGTFYHYFVCKEDVVREFSTRVIEEIFTTAMTMPGGPQEKLTYYFNAILHEACKSDPPMDPRYHVSPLRRRRRGKSPRRIS